MSALADVLDALQRRQIALEPLLERDGKEHVSRLFARARLRAADTRATEAARRAAIGLLGRRDEDTAALGRLLVPQNSSAIQAATVSALGRMSEQGAVRVLLARWDSYSPALRTAVLDMVLNRDAWLPELFASLDKGTVKAGHLDATRR